MGIKTFLLTLSMFSAFQTLVGQVANTYTITINDDQDPLQAEVVKKEIIVTLKPEDVVNFDFSDFADKAKKFDLQIVDLEMNKITSTKTLDISSVKTLSFDLEVDELYPVRLVKDKIYLIKLVDGENQQSVFRFKITS